MRNALLILTRDIKRLARVRKAWIIIFGAMITPSLYAWVNIAAFWDPYLQTENVSVAVVNQDEGGTSSTTGDVDVGAQVVKQLEDDDQLGWEFLDEDDAMEAVKSGSSYAVIVIPPSFSRDLLSITSGDFTRPSLTYYVNEKANAVAPKITDIGASTLDTQINSTFVSVVAEAVTDEIVDAGLNTERRLRGAQENTVDTLADAADSVASTRARIGELDRNLSGVRDGIRSAGGTLNTVDSTLGEVQIAVGQAQQIAAEAQQEFAGLTGSLMATYVSGTTLLADAAETLNRSVAGVTTVLDRADVAVESSLASADDAAARTANALTEVQALVAASVPDPQLAGPLNNAATILQDRLTKDRDILVQVQQLNADVAEVSTAIRSSTDAVEVAANSASASAGAVREVLLQTAPDINSAMSQLSSSAGALSSAINSQRAQLGQAQNLLSGLDEQVSETSKALGALDRNLSGVEDGLNLVRTDVSALSTADVWDKLGTLTGLNAEQIAQFFQSPVEVDERPVFPVNNYGSAMAPLFANLSLWIGAFVLVVIFKLEVDKAGISRLTVRQAYLGRWLLLAVMSAIQALVLAIGIVLLGVQIASIAAFVATLVLIGLTYLSIIYALSVSFGYVGKGLCVLLIIVQIPGAAGLYPIELMPEFFRSLYPALPFTYGINALRETIGGFYDGHYWKNLAALSVFVALSFLLGLVLRERLGNFALLFNRQLAATHLLVTEDVHFTGQRYRLPQIVHALVNSDEYRHIVRDRAHRFTRRYPTVLRATATFSVLVVLSLALLGWLMPKEKGTILGLWVVSFLLIVGFVVALEYVKQSIELARDLGRMSDAELRRELLRSGTGQYAMNSNDEEMEQHTASDAVSRNRVGRGEGE